MLAIACAMLLVGRGEMGFSSGPLVGASQLAAESKGWRLKEVVRIWIEEPCEVTSLHAAFAGSPGTAELHVWKDIDHEWPFYRFEQGMVKPVRVTCKRSDLLKWQRIKVGARPIVIENPGYLFVGLVVRERSPRLAVDAKLDHPANSRYEAYDLKTPRPKKAYWLRPSGDYAVRIQTKELPQGDKLFQDVTTQVGLGKARGKAIAWGDVDGDGWEDLLLSGTHLFRNVQGKRFEDVTSRADLGQNGFGIFADVDNDGDLDLFLAADGTVGYDRVMLNDGKGRFTESPSQIGDGWPSKSATWLDYDLDGRVDLFVANGADGLPTRNRLWRNIGKGRFVLAPVKAINGSNAPVAFNRSGVAADLDLDGRAEIAVGTLRLQPDQLWWFTNSGAADRAKNYRFDVARSPAGKITGGQGAGVAIGDLDGDARPDIWVANLMHPDWRGYEGSVLSAFFMSRGRQGFTRRAADAVGLDFDESPAAPTLADFDNDGDLDAFVGSSYHHGDFYENVGGRFRNRTHRSGIQSRRGEASAACDFDRDGRVDIAVETEGRIRLYRNVVPALNWLRVQMPAHGRSIGASVLLKHDGRWQLRQVIAGRGLGSQDTSILHFGLGKAQATEAMRVIWPGGRKAGLQAPGTNRQILINR